MELKFNIIFSVFDGLFSLISGPSKKIDDDMYKIKCENCGHVDFYDNFEPFDASCKSFFCPSCDDWTYEWPFVDPQENSRIGFLKTNF